MDTIRLTQVHRALQPWGVTRIPAYSPEARGRSERAFRTVQDRLPHELARAGITEMAAANRYLTEQFLPQSHDRWMVRATEPGTAFVPWVGTHLAEILCVCTRSGSWPRTTPCGSRERVCRSRRTPTASMT